SLIAALPTTDVLAGAAQSAEEPPLVSARGGFLLPEIQALPAKRTPISSFLRHTTSQRRKTFPLFEMARMNFGGNCDPSGSTCGPILRRAPVSEISRIVQPQIGLPSG